MALMSFTSKPLVRFACRSSLVLTRCFSSVTFVEITTYQHHQNRAFALYVFPLRRRLLYVCNHFSVIAW